MTSTPSPAHWRLVRLLLVCLALSLGLVACGSKGDDGEAKAEAATAKRGGGGGGGGGRGGPSGPRGVRVEPAERGPLALEVDLIGEVLAREVVELSPLESGQLVELRVDEGDRVEAGQVVARLDQTLEQRGRTQAEKRVASSDAQLARQQAEVDAARREVARRRGLVERNAFPAAELQRLEDELAVLEQGLAVAEAQKSEARASVASARTEVDRRAVVAPFAGLVVERHVSTGAMVSPQSPILTVVDDTSLRFVTRLSELRSAGLGKDTRAQIRLDAAPELELPARVVRVGQIVDRESRTIELELAIELPEGSPLTLRHGMFGRGRLAVSELEEVVHVPLAAIDREARVPGQKATVWTVGPESSARAAEVEVLLVTERRIAVRGLEAGERVIVSGSRGLEDGAAVVVAAAPGASPAATPSPEGPAQKGPPGAGAEGKPASPSGEGPGGKSPSQGPGVGGKP